MSQTDKAAAEREILQDAQRRGKLATFLAYFRLSGPGWLQSAITLGGGSLASSLYLGVLTGVAMLWLQPLAMVLGIIMLSAIGYVTMSTGKRPFRAINEHVNPVLGWSWALASLAANMVWCLPQYSLANSVLEQTLLPAKTGDDLASQRLIIVGVILFITTMITWSYGSGNRGVKIYELMLKILVAVIVLSFIAVVVVLSTSGGLSWSEIGRGLIPDFSRFSEPAEQFRAPLSELSEKTRVFWTGYIVGEQRNVMISAAATAVGINMTFLFPYTILKKGWTREFRGLCVFDLFTGMLIPFVLATSCVIIAAASQFHGPSKPIEGYLGETKNGKVVIPKSLQGVLKARLKAEPEDDELYKGKSDDEKVMLLHAKLKAVPDQTELKIAASLAKRDANHLAGALKPLADNDFGKVVFGIGVLGMTLSTISLLMLISGFVVCEILNVEPTGWPFRLGTLLAATGVLGPFVWSGAGFYLAVPTSIFGMSLLPLAYLTFFLLMNQRKVLGNDTPTGGRRFLINVLMAISAGVALAASTWVIYGKAGYWGFLAVISLLFLAIAIPPRHRSEDQA